MQKNIHGFQLQLHAAKIKTMTSPVSLPTFKLLYKVWLLLN